MLLRSLGYRTDLIFHRFDGEVLDRGDYLAIRIPTQQGYYWGNLLLFPGAPEPGDFSRWQALFEKEFQDLPGVRHQTFGWDDPEGGAGDLEPFLAAGFHNDPGVVLTASQTHPAARGLDSNLEVRSLESEADWEDAIACQVACRDPSFAEAVYFEFVRKRMASLRSMVGKGLGKWFGAFLEGRQVGNLGIFLAEDVGRFQTVGTLPEFRGRGVCANLVHRTSQFALEEMGARVLVLVTDPESQADRVYQSVGYRPREIQPGVCRWP